MEDAISVVLRHLGMDIEARVAELGDFLGEEDDTVDGVAEDHGLIDLEFTEEGVKAVDLLSFLYECIVLGHTTQREFFHQVDLVWIVHALFLE